MRKFITLLSLTALIISGLSISGCNTMRGFGKDVERGGERVQDAAKPKPDSTPQQGK
jgi:predicted small secreted protein